MLAGVPYGATQTDTAEYMLGDVQVSVVFIESSLSSTNTETWDAPTIARVKNTIQVGLQWWEDMLHKDFPNAPLDFHLNFNHADTPFVVGYEPIEYTSFQTVDFINAFLASKGYTAGNTDDRMYAFNHNERATSGTDWAFTIFVVNDENDNAQSNGNGAFAPGGFGKSFAYPGGRYLVTLSDRPAEIIAHETAHIFWGLDEYANGGDHYTVKRGYYNVQNLNGANGAPQGFVQQPSLLATTNMLATSFLNKTLPASTQAHIGWRDSDGDKIIDVLDVAHSLVGSGRTDPLTGKYRFVGKSQVRTLPNLNSAGNQNDITINRINVAEYSLDNGTTWQTAATYDTHTADLDLTITLAGQSQIMIRTRDTRTGVVSDLFSALTSQPTSISPAGITGFVYRDADQDGSWDGSESPLANRMVRLVDAGGTPLPGPVVLDPSNYAFDTDLSRKVAQATLAIIGDFPSSAVMAYDATYGATSSRVFGGADLLETQWSSEKRLKINFNTTVKQVSIDVIGTSTSGGSYGRLEIYDATNKLLGRYTTSSLSLGQTQTMTLSSTSDIAYAIAFGHMDTFVALDRLVIGAPTSTTTNALGAYSLPYLAAGTYRVQAVSPQDWSATAPSTSVQQVSLSASNQLSASALFGQVQVAFGWHNLVDGFDVDGDAYITPLDALIVINNLNAFGARELPDVPSGESPPYFVDVNGDGFCSPLDALAVIIRLNAGGSSEPTGTTVAAGGAGGASEAAQAEATLDSKSFSAAAAPMNPTPAQVNDLALLELSGAPLEQVDLPTLIGAFDNDPLELPVVDRTLASDLPSMAAVVEHITGQIERAAERRSKRGAITRGGERTSDGFVLLGFDAGRQID